MTPVINSGICDTITVELHNAVSPFGTEYTTRSTINTGGSGMFNFPQTVSGNSYYIAVFNHNTLKTWTSAPVNFTSTPFYDFTTAASQAYGNNMKDLGDGNFALYSGDVTRDDLININDYDEIKTSVLLFLTGYVPDDLTGDHLVESADFTLIENNGFLLFTIHP
jgi:hypothetical protein